MLKKRFKLHITTNGANLDLFLKSIIIHRNFISSINPTVDSVVDNSVTRKEIEDIKKNNSSDNIIKNSLLLLQYGVPVNIATNIDRNNLHSISNINSKFKELGLFNFKNFRWDIGRVDDRLFETKYKYIVSETDILYELLKLDDLPENLHAAFLKSIHPLCKQQNISFNRSELKNLHCYCWASSNIDKVFYIDSDLDTFRCTYTVGRKEFEIFKFNIDNLEKFKLRNRSFLDYECCKNCKIGGYCSGSCALSFNENKEEQCKYELENFEKFIKLIYIPIIEDVLHEPKN